MSDQKLRIEIETRNTGSGVQQTAAGVAQVAAAAKQAAPAVAKVGADGAQMAQGLAQGAAAGNAAVAAVAQLTTATQGGAAGFLALARGAFGAGMALRGVLTAMGPIGAIAAGIGIALGLVSAALRKNEEQAEAARKELEKLDKVKVDELVRQLGGIKRAADEGKAALEAEAELIDRIADAKLARDKAAIKADKSKSAEQMERAIIDLERQREDERIAQGIDTARRRSSIDFRAQDLAGRLYGRAGAEEAKLNEIIARYEGAKAEEGRLQAQEYFIDKSDLAAVDAQADAVAAARKRREDLEPAYVKALAELPGATERATAALKSYGEAVKAAETSSADYLQAVRTEAGVKQYRNQERKLTDEANRPETEAEKAKREAAEKKARELMEWRMRELGPIAVANRIAGGDKAFDIEAARAMFPGYKFKAPESSSAPQASTPKPATPGAGVYRPGEELPTNTTGVYRPGERLPGPAVDSRNQVTRGALQPGSDNKQLATSAQQLNENMGKVAEAKPVDLKPAAEASEKVAENQETQAAALDEYTARHVAAAAAFATFAGEATATLGAQAATISSLSARVATLASQVSSMRSRGTT